MQGFYNRRGGTDKVMISHICMSSLLRHGRAYLDGLTLDGKEPVCECHSCYGGPQCSEFLTGCAANADSGDPYFLEPFWMQHASKSALVVPGWHRMSYTFADQSYISAELERHIRKLHASLEMP
ncbi:hypothetical protein L3X38_041690 [Prunus dulcis]|uniref:Uncharacterized protein n=1 Tax=Prunus dulcis TaxID=3755 RepID=A0AAD4YJJ9_PRUDU|nr:hypothetical protein L3X38_041690 [Prunus dulcis]